MLEAEQQKIENEKKRAELTNAYKRLFTSDDGKKVCEDLERFCGQNRTSVCEQSPDAYQTMFQEGKRRVFLRIKAMLEKKDG